jgi:hypothetical protein
MTEPSLLGQLHPRRNNANHPLDTKPEGFQSLSGYHNEEKNPKAPFYFTALH